MTLYLLYFLIGIVTVQLFYYLGVFSGFVFSKSTENNSKKIPVSVIVYSKNQAKELLHLIPALLNQNYYMFELVVVNNASSDQTPELLKEFEMLYPNVKAVNVINNEAFWGSKKYALTLGIKAAKHEYLLLINAEDIVLSNDWMLQMASHFTLNKTLVLGGAAYAPEKGFFNKYLRFDLLMSQLQQFSWIKIGSPFAVRVENVGFKKQVFFDVNGFINHMNQVNHTNELFFNEAVHVKNIAVCDQPHFFLQIPTPENSTSFFKMKKEQRRLLSKLSFGTKFRVQFFYLSTFLFYVTAIILLILQVEWVLVSSLMAFKFLFTWVILGKAMQKFVQKDLIWMLPFWEPVHLFTQMIVFIRTLGSK